MSESKLRTLFMKKIIAFLLMILCVLSMVSCANQQTTILGKDTNPSNYEETQDTNPLTNTVQTELYNKEWTEQEILTLFLSKAKPNWTVIDCVSVSDFAFDRIGVVLFTDDGHARLAFIDKEGSHALTGIEAQPSTPANLTYCGNGVVTFVVQIDTDTTCSYKITFSQSEDGTESNFIIEDSL